MCKSEVQRLRLHGSIRTETAKQYWKVFTVPEGYRVVSASIWRPEDADFSDIAHHGHVVLDHQRVIFFWETFATNIRTEFQVILERASEPDLVLSMSEFDEEWDQGCF